MKTLEHEISEALKRYGVYVVGDARLRRIWPDPKHRYIGVKDFAAANGWRLFAYGEGRGAMFVRKGKATPEIRSKLDLDWWCATGEPAALTRVMLGPGKAKPRIAGSYSR